MVFTVALVPTGINIGVSISPCSVLSTEARALERLSTAIRVNFIRNKLVTKVENFSFVI